MRKFTALYTHQKLKKAKTWQDGFAHYNDEAKELVLFDNNNARITSYRLRTRETIELSNEYDVGRYLVTLEEEEKGEHGSHELENRSIAQEQSHTTKPFSRSTLLKGKQIVGLGGSKGTKRLPSLIKPIKLKSSSCPPECIDSSMGVENSIGDTCTKPDPHTSFKQRQQGILEYTVLYTSQKTKKAKTWSDGVLSFYESEHRIVLKGQDGGTVLSTHLPKSKSIEIGGEMESGMYLIQIECIRGNEAASATNASNELTLQLQGVLKRRHDTLLTDNNADQPNKPGITRGSLQKLKLCKKVSNVLSSESTQNTSTSATTTITAISTGTNTAQTLPIPKRASFVIPEQQIVRYLHFPKRGELLQHVSVSKGYGFGPARKLAAPVAFIDWKVYQKKFSELLRENLMAELSALAIRYFFMAREKHEGCKQFADVNSSSNIPSYKQKQQRKRSSKLFGGGIGGGPSLAQACKSVGVLFFDECTARQPFMDSAAFKAQLNKGSVYLGKGDTIMLELSRRESYAGYAKDDTWAISSSEDFTTESTFLARSVFFGPSKNNMLELMLVGDEDALAASKIFNSIGGVGGSKAKRRIASSDKAASGLVAIRCLDSSSDWSMIDTVEQNLSPDTLPILPHLLQMPAIGPSIHPVLGNDTKSNDILDKIGSILDEKRLDFCLNEEQFLILNQVVMSTISVYVPIEGSSPITIVHGPFGTGKSFLVSVTVICLNEIANQFPEIFNNTGNIDSENEQDDITEDGVGQNQQHQQQQQQKMGSPPPLRILLSSMTNFAVDNMLCALLKQGYDEFLRVGNLKRISKQILPYVCRSSSSTTEDIKELETMLEAASDELERDAICTAIQRLRQQRSQDALSSAFVIGTTCLSAATTALQGVHFPLVILDEACQIVEPMALIALANAQCQRLVLVGDPLQLPPTLTTRATKDAEGKGLDRALFDRLVQMGHKPRFLSVQYRCHPRIGSLCNQLFYSGRLRHGITSSNRQPLIPGIPSLSFLDTAGQEKQQGKSQSFFNKNEIDMATQLVQRLILGGVQPEAIGIIALYKTQADMLQEQLASFLGQRSRVQVSTVDAYQGSEREIIIVSCVRTDKIGFISNPNRVNVALSRARSHCMILGNHRLLETNTMWRKIIEYCREDIDAGFVSAQTFLNRLTTAIADNSAENEQLSAQEAELDIYPSQSLAEVLLESDMSEEESKSCQEMDRTSGIDVDEDNGNEENMMENYPEEGVVGSLLSQQWSLPSIDYMDHQSSISDDDILECLDVDLDEM